jgi:MFS family permease
MKHDSLSPITIWLICILAAIGFAFDTYELLMMPLVLRPSLVELTGLQPGTPEFQAWAARFFFVPGLLGGFFGLIGGYLTDRFGRRRVLTYSILLYSISAFCAALSTNVYQFLFFRTLTFIGVCVEFVAAVAWLSELFPPGKTRERVLGYTQAFASVGGLLVAIANAWILANPEKLPALPWGWLPEFWGTPKNPAAAWRYTLASGVIPALPLILIRPFLPESPQWLEASRAGTLKRPSIRELFQPELRPVTIVTLLMVAASYGVALGAFQQVPQIVPGLPEVQTATADLPPPEKSVYSQKQAAQYTKAQEWGGLLGRVMLAMLAVPIVGRRKLLSLFVLPALILVPITMYLLAKGINPLIVSLGGFDIRLFHVTLFTSAMLIVGQFSFWGNYLPRVYPLHLRGTGESVAANIGGRMIGTSMAAVTNYLSTWTWPGFAKGPQSIAIAAACVAATLMFLSMCLLPFLREPTDAEE